MTVSSRRSPVVALAATTTVGYGVLFYAYGVLLVPMENDLGWSRTYLSGAFTLALIVGALLTVPVGRWLDHHPPRALFLAGGGAASLLVVGWAASESRSVFVVSWILLGTCQAVLFYEPAFTVLTKRFEGHRRNRAITTVTLAAGLASTIFAPLTALLERTLGWRGAVLVLALILAVVTLPAFAFGLRPQSEAPPERPPEQLRSSKLPSDAFRSVDFWLLVVAYLLAAITTFGVAVHLVPFLHGRGMATGQAATALGAVGLVQVLGRSTFIRLSVGRRAVDLATWVLAAKALGLALLVLVRGWPGVILFILVYGSSNGVATLTRATTLAELYGPRYYGSISAVMAAVTALGGALAPFAVAAVADAVGAVAPVLGALVVLSVLAAAANEVVARPTRGRDRVGAWLLTVIRRLATTR